MGRRTELCIRNEMQQSCDLGAADRINVLVDLQWQHEIQEGT